MPIRLSGGTLFEPLHSDYHNIGMPCRDRVTGDSATIIRYSEMASGFAPNPKDQRKMYREDVFECVITKRTKNSHHQEGDVVMLTNPI